MMNKNENEQFLHTMGHGDYRIFFDSKAGFASDIKQC